MTTVLEPPNLDEIVLEKGAHPGRDNGVCVMELAAWVAGRPHSDAPPCVSPAIGAFLRAWNDSLADEPRQMLKPYARLVLNTATTSEDEERRGWLAMDWMIREFTPAWLRLAGLTDHAVALEGLVPIFTGEAARAAEGPISAADSAADSAARSAADSAARSAARSAADSAADSAAYSALEPTTAMLQKSALLLLDRMIAVGKSA